MGHESSDELWTVLDAIREAGGRIVEVSRPRPALQDVFVRAIRQDAPEQDTAEEVQ
jgi:hypothetical protein